MEQDAPPTLDTGYDSVGQANAALTPFGGLPGEPSGYGPEVGASDLVERFVNSLQVTSASAPLRWLL